MGYTEKDYELLKMELERLGEQGYKEFTMKLSPTLSEAEVYGVRMPALKGVAKELAKGDRRGYLALARPDTHEERMIKGLVIGLMSCPIAERLAYVRDFVPWINNWAVCDTFSASLKAVRKARESSLAFLGEYSRSTEEYPLRFYIVMLMDHFVTQEYIDLVIDELARIRHGGYYVKMAAAWAACECFIKFRDKTFRLLEYGLLDDFTNNKAIQKIRESYRVSDGDKLLLKNFRRK